LNAIAVNILQLVNRIPYPLTNGGNIATWNLSLALENLGNKITLACLNTKKHYQTPDILKGKVNQFLAIDIDTSIHPMKAALNLFSPIPYIAERFISDEFKVMLSELLRQNTFDIIQLEGLYMAVYLPEIRKYTNSPVVLRAHNIEYKIWERIAANTRNPLKKLYFMGMSVSLKKYEKRILNQVDGVLYFTDEDYRWAQTAGVNTRSVVIPAGVDLEAFSVGPQMHYPVSMGFLGSLDWRPNQDAVCWFVSEILPLIQKKVPEVKFYIAGKHMPLHLLKELSHASVIYLGEIPDAAQFLKSLDLMVVPLRSGGGMRLKILEGMAASRAIVSTSIGAEGIQVQSGEHLILEDEKEGFAKACIDILQDQQFRTRLGNSGHKQAEKKYSWHNIAGETHLFYQSML